MSIVTQLKTFQTGSIQAFSVTETVVRTFPTTGSKLPQKLTQTISQLSLKSNEISSFLSETNVSGSGGNKPFSILEFAKNLSIKQQAEPTTGNSQITDLKPLTKKLKQQQKQLIDQVVQNYIRSGKLINVLEKNLNKILQQSPVNFVSVENGQIVAQDLKPKIGVSGGKIGDLGVGAIIGIVVSALGAVAAVCVCEPASRSLVVVVVLLLLRCMCICM
jgi:hypothetical protein